MRFERKEMEGKRLSDDSVLKTDPRYRKLEHLIQVGFTQRLKDRDKQTFKGKDRLNVLQVDAPHIVINILRAEARARFKRTKT